MIFKNVHVSDSVSLITMSYENLPVASNVALLTLSGNTSVIKVRVFFTFQFRFELSLQFFSFSSVSLIHNFSVTVSVFSIVFHRI